jgi:hypothetical protein
VAHQGFELALETEDGAVGLVVELVDVEHVGGAGGEVAVLEDAGVSGEELGGEEFLERVAGIDPLTEGADVAGDGLVVAGVGVVHLGELAENDVGEEAFVEVGGGGVLFGAGDGVWVGFAADEVGFEFEGGLAEDDADFVFLDSVDVWAGFVGHGRLLWVR